MTCKHEWGPWIRLCEPTFHVCYGSYRVCRLCGGEEFSDYTEGRIGGPARLTMPDKMKENTEGI